MDNHFDEFQNEKPLFEKINYSNYTKFQGKKLDEALAANEAYILSLYQKYIDPEAGGVNPERFTPHFFAQIYLEIEQNDTPFQIIATNGALDNIEKERRAKGEFHAEAFRHMALTLDQMYDYSARFKSKPDLHRLTKITDNARKELKDGYFLHSIPSNPGYENEDKFKEQLALAERYRRIQEVNPDLSRTEIAARLLNEDLRTNKPLVYSNVNEEGRENVTEAIRRYLNPLFLIAGETESVRDAEIEEVYHLYSENLYSYNRIAKEVNVVDSKYGDIYDPNMFTTFSIRPMPLDATDFAAIEDHKKDVAARNKLREADRKVFQNYLNEHHQEKNILSVSVGDKTETNFNEAQGMLLRDVLLGKIPVKGMGPTANAKDVGRYIDGLIQTNSITSFELMWVKDKQVEEALADFKNRIEGPFRGRDIVGLFSDTSALQQPWFKRLGDSDEFNNLQKAVTRLFNPGFDPMASKELLLKNALAASSAYISHKKKEIGAMLRKCQTPEEREALYAKNPIEFRRYIFCCNLSNELTRAALQAGVESEDLSTSYASRNRTRLMDKLMIEPNTEDLTEKEYSVALNVLSANNPQANTSVEILSTLINNLQFPAPNTESDKKTALYEAAGFNAATKKPDNTYELNANRVNELCGVYANILKLPAPTEREMKAVRDSLQREIVKQNKSIIEKEQKEIAEEAKKQLTADRTLFRHYLAHFAVQANSDQWRQLAAVQLLLSAQFGILVPRLATVQFGDKRPIDPLTGKLNEEAFEKVGKEAERILGIKSLSEEMKNAVREQFLEKYNELTANNNEKLAEYKAAVELMGNVAVGDNGTYEPDSASKLLVQVSDPNPGDFANNPMYIGPDAFFDAHNKYSVNKQGVENYTKQLAEITGMKQINVADTFKFELQYSQKIEQRLADLYKNDSVKLHEMPQSGKSFDFSFPHTEEEEAARETELLADKKGDTEKAEHILSDMLSAAFFPTDQLETYVPIDLAAEKRTKHMNVYVNYDWKEIPEPEMFSSEHVARYEKYANGVANANKDFEKNKEEVMANPNLTEIEKESFIQSLETVRKVELEKLGPEVPKASNKELNRYLDEEKRYQDSYAELSEIYDKQLEQIAGSNKMNERQKEVFSQNIRKDFEREMKKASPHIAEVREKEISRYEVNENGVNDLMKWAGKVNGVSTDAMYKLSSEYNLTSRFNVLYDRVRRTREFVTEKCGIKLEDLSKPGKLSEIAGKFVSENAKNDLTTITSPYSATYGADRKHFDEFVSQLQQYTLCKIPKEIVKDEFEKFNTAQMEIEKQKPIEQIEAQMKEEVKEMPQEEQSKARSMFYSRVPIQNMLAFSVKDDLPQEKYQNVVGQNEKQLIIDENVV